MAGTREPEAEIRWLRRQLQALRRQVRENQSLLERNQSRELELLGAESLPELLHRLVGGLEASYELDRVTLLVADPQHELRHLLMDSGHRVDEFPDVVFVDAVHGAAPQIAGQRRPWLGPYRPADHQLVFPGGGSEQLSSVALLPLFRQDRLIGSLNFGSRDPNRYTRHHGSDFLAHLAVIAAFCLENAVNRARLMRAGLTDVLTGWHNRRYLQSRMREELSRARRDGSTIACLMIDVDHFKSVNDRYGHLAGDQVLRELAQRLDGEIRSSDIAARFGGEEFAVVLPNADARSGLNLAERMRTAVEAEPFELPDGRTLAVTVSIGVAELAPGESGGDPKSLAEGLLAQADVALYRAKSAGRNTVVAA
jgi:diguanylate cyclase (GGDEF)-like protein